MFEDFFIRAVFEVFFFRWFGRSGYSICREVFWGDSFSGSGRGFVILVCWVVDLIVFCRLIF